ncbi:MAG TPA: hypothetical protein VGJ20_13605 [Xanthobacteraceae bacterium]|jgi:hypothetical protein
MINISQAALIAAVLAVGIATPTFAQSFDPEAGSGNVVPFSFAPTTAPTVVQPNRITAGQARRRTLAVHHSGLSSFALVPSVRGDGNAYDPTLTGGGSTGYNQNARAVW